MPQMPAMCYTGYKSCEFLGGYYRNGAGKLFGPCEGSGSIPRPHINSQAWWCLLLIPVLGRRLQADPWCLIAARQPA